MSDLLSAASLLMAIAAILFSLWYSEIAKALEMAPSQFSEDNKTPRHTVTTVLCSKAIPVAIMALAVALIFLPDTLKIARDSYLGYVQNGFAAFEKYDAVRTAYCFVNVLSWALAGYMCTLVVQLFDLRRRLSQCR
jgi:hypothetical protein